MLGFLNFLFLTPKGRLLVAALATASLLIGVYGAGKRNERLQQELKDAREFNETGERVRDAIEDSSSGSGDDNLDWLRDFSLSE